MNFLDTVKRVRQECDGTGTGPSAVTNQTGESKRFVDWTVAAWNTIQGKHTNWRWMRSTFTLPLTTDDGTYAYTDATDTIAAAVISRFSRWIVGERDFPWRIYKTSDGVSSERYLEYMPYNTFRRQFRMGTQNSGPPAYYSVDPQNNVLIGPKPDAAYVVSGDYQRSAQTLAANDDTPELPAQYHMLIVYEAMKLYARFESAPEVMAGAADEGGRLWRQLEINQRPQMDIAGPMA